MGMQRNRSARQAEAKERAAVRATLTGQQQLARLDSLFGAGVGAKKERARLTKTIADATKQKPSSPKKSKTKKKAAAKKEE
mgnify:CR=1 FL=1